MCRVQTVLNCHAPYVERRASSVERRASSVERGSWGFTPQPRAQRRPRQPVRHQDYAASGPGWNGHSPRVEVRTRAAGASVQAPAVSDTTSRRPVRHQDYAASGPGWNGHSPRVEVRTRAAGASVQAAATVRPVSQCGIKSMPRPDGVELSRSIRRAFEARRWGSRRMPQRNDVLASTCGIKIMPRPARVGRPQSPC
jgi:hypothetical protein